MLLETGVFIGGAVGAGVHCSLFKSEMLKKLGLFLLLSDRHRETQTDTHMNKDESLTYLALLKALRLRSD